MTDSYVVKESYGTVGDETQLETRVSRLLAHIIAPDRGAVLAGIGGCWLLDLNSESTCSTNLSQYTDKHIMGGS